MVGDDVLGISIINLLVPTSLGSSACGQNIVTILYLGRGGGILVSAEQLKDMHQIVIYIPLGGTRSPVIILIINYLNLLFGTWGRPRRLKLFL